MKFSGKVTGYEEQACGVTNNRWECSKRGPVGPVTQVDNPAFVVHLLLVDPWRPEEENAHQSGVEGAISGE